MSARALRLWRQCQIELTTGTDKGVVPLGINRVATVHWTTQKSIGFRANGQLSNRKRSGHCVRIVLRKSPAIVTVECGAEMGVRGGPCEYSYVIELEFDSGVLHVNQPCCRMLLLYTEQV